MDTANLIANQRKWLARGESLEIAHRKKALGKLRAGITAARKDLIDSLYVDLHKGPYEVISSEVAFVLAEIDFAIRNLSKWAKPQRRPTPLMALPARAWVRSQPLGVALILGPWNYPAQLLLAPLVGALAAGCSAIIKPSELAPATSSVIARLIHDSFDPKHVAVVEGGQEAAESLLSEQFDTIFFTGSSSVGKAVMTAAAKHLTPVTLELGGKCPCVVTADADIALAARRIAWGKMLNAGQTCIAPDYVLVDHRRHDELVEALKRSLVQFFGTAPRESTDFGRIVNPRHVARLIAYLSDGNVAHGGDHDVENLYLAPTVLTNPRHDAPVMRDEIFGPILPVRTFDGDIDTALRVIAAQGAPLAAYLFSRNRGEQVRFEERVHAGGVCVNDVAVQMFGKHLPFGGVGPSGMGRYHGKSSFDAFSNLKTVVRSSGWVDLPYRSPPVKMPLLRFERMLRLFLKR